MDGSLGLWDVVSGKLLHVAQPKAKELYTVDWSPNGEVLATAGRNAQLTLWNSSDLSILKELKVSDWVICVRFSPDGCRLLSSGGSPMPGGERMVQVWGLPGDEVGEK